MPTKPVDPDFVTPAFDKPSAPPEVVAWQDNGQRRRHNDAPAMDTAAFAALLTEAEADIDEAHAAAKKAVVSITAKIVKLNGNADKGGIAKGDLDRLAALQMKLSALDATSPQTLLQPNPGGGFYPAPAQYAGWPVFPGQPAYGTYPAGQAVVPPPTPK